MVEPSLPFVDPKVSTLSMTRLFSSRKSSPDEEWDLNGDDVDTLREQCAVMNRYTELYSSGAGLPTVAKVKTCTRWSGGERDVDIPAVQLCLTFTKRRIFSAPVSSNAPRNSSEGRKTALMLTFMAW